MRRVAIAALLALLACGCGRATPSTLAVGGFDEKEMDAAIAHARKTVDQFIAELQKPTGEEHAVKAPVTDSAGTEHFWLTDVTLANGEFTGRIGNDPGIVSNVKIGQQWKLKTTEISDWMYMKNGKIVGNFTMRPLLKNMPEDEAAKLRSMLAEP